jgi:hypothetical protein
VFKELGNQGTSELVFVKHDERPAII